MIQPQRKLPDWNDVLEALGKIPADPDFLTSVKEILLLFLLRWIREYVHYKTHMAVYMRCLRKYGAVPPVNPSPRRDYGNPLWGEYWQRQDTRRKQIREKLESTAQDWYEAIALARALDLLSEQTGTGPEVKDFLYKLKVRLWHIDEYSGSIIETIFIHGSKKYRCILVWLVRLQCTARVSMHRSIGECSHYSLACPPLENWKKDWRTGSWEDNAKGCHYSITSGELNVFVLYAMQSKRPLKQADFWGILANRRIDFLEFLLVDMPGKKLPYSMINIIQLVVESQNDAFALEVLRLIERTHPGLLASISDPHGGNLLWYLVCKFAKKPSLDKNGTILLTPLQSFLYGLCDHASPNCDGISFDDLCRYYPSKFLGTW